IYFGENQISPGLISLSLRSTAHPPGFQPRSVRPSTRSYPRFSLAMDSSPGFGSAASDCTPCSDSLSLRLALKLNLARHQQLAGPLCKKYAVTTRRLLRPLVSVWFQVLFHSPCGVLFTFPSRYWFTIGHTGVFSLTRWSSLIHTGFHVPHATRDSASILPLSTTGLSPSLVQVSAASSNFQIPCRC